MCCSLPDDLTISVEGTVEVIARRWWSRGCCREGAFDLEYQCVSEYVCVRVRFEAGWGLAGRERPVHFTAVVGLCGVRVEGVSLALLSHSNMLLIQQHAAGTATSTLITASLSPQWINLHSNPQSTTLTPVYTLPTHRETDRERERERGEEEQRRKQAGGCDSEKARNIRKW